MLHAPIRFRVALAVVGLAAFGSSSAEASGTIAASLDVTTSCAVTDTTLAQPSLGQAGAAAFPAQPGNFGDTHASLPATGGGNAISVLYSPGLTPSLLIGGRASRNQVGYHLSIDSSRLSGIAVGDVLRSRHREDDRLQPADLRARQQQRRRPDGRCQYRHRAGDAELAALGRRGRADMRQFIAMAAWSCLVAGAPASAVTQLPLTISADYGSQPSAGVRRLAISGDSTTPTPYLLSVNGTKQWTSPSAALSFLVHAKAALSDPITASAYHDRITEWLT